MTGWKRAVAVSEGVFAGGEPYLKVGSGEPLVYLSGFATQHRVPTGMGRAITVKTVAPFARAGYAVYFTLPAPHQPFGVTFADLAASCAVSLAEHFGVPVNVLGHSTGGSLALQLIADHPESVRRAVVASAAYELGTVARFAQLPLAEHLEKSGRFRADLLAPGFTKNPVLQRLLSVPLRLMSLPKVQQPSDPARVLRAENDYSVFSRLETITTPTLVIWGERDHFTPKAMFEETAQRLPNGKAICYPTAGHAVTTHKRFVGDVLAFLEPESTT